MPKSYRRKSKASGSTIRYIERLVQTGWHLSMRIYPRDWLRPKRQRTEVV